MQITKFLEALETIIYIATHASSGRVCSKSICEYQNVNVRHLEPILQLLVKNNILSGSKGPKGGYSLAMEKRKLTAGMIYQVFLDEMVSKNVNNSKLGKKIIQPIREDIDNKVKEYLDNLTIAQLCKRSKDIFSQEDDVQGKNSEGFVI